MSSSHHFSDNSSGFGALVIFVAHIGSWLLSGLWAFELVNPHSFGKVIVFLIAWGILGAAVDWIIVFVVGLVLMLFSDKK